MAERHARLAKEAASVASASNSTLDVASLPATTSLYYNVVHSRSSMHRSRALRREARVPKVHRMPSSLIQRFSIPKAAGKRPTMGHWFKEIQSLRCSIRKSSGTSSSTSPTSPLRLALRSKAALIGSDENSSWTTTRRLHRRWCCRRLVGPAHFPSRIASLGGQRTLGHHPLSPSNTRRSGCHGGHGQCSVG